MGKAVCCQSGTRDAPRPLHRTASSQPFLCTPVQDSSVVMLAILLVFAIAHSGLAFLRPYGARPARSLPAHAMPRPTRKDRGAASGLPPQAARGWRRRAAANLHRPGRAGSPSLALFLMRPALPAAAAASLAELETPCRAPFGPALPCAPLAAAAGEELIGARAYRVIFALVSLPLAIAAVVYFIDHRYDGVPLWNVR